MADFKCVFNYTGPSGESWSDTFYRQSANLADAATMPAIFLSARASLLHESVRMKSCRISSIENNRVATVKTLNFDGLAARNGPAPIGQAAIYNLSSIAVPSSRRWWSRGHCEGDYTRNPDNGAVVILNVVSQATLNFFQQCFNAGFEVLPLQRIAPGGLQYAIIEKIDGHTTPGYSTLTTKTNLGVNVGDRIIVSKTDRVKFPRLNARFTVTKVGANTLEVKYDAQRYTVDVPLTGRVRKEAYQSGAFISPANSGFSHLRTRDTKSPFSSSRGSKRAGPRS